MDLFLALLFLWCRLSQFMQVREVLETFRAIGSESIGISSSALAGLEDFIDQMFSIRNN